jgi:hypothetical protein
MVRIPKPSHYTVLIETGVGGYEGWRWIFILEGLATVLMGVAVFWLLPDSPSHAEGRWLTADEARFLRLNNLMTRGVKKERGVNADGRHPVGHHGPGCEGLADLPPGHDLCFQRRPQLRSEIVRLPRENNVKKLVLSTDS